MSGICQTTLKYILVILVRVLRWGGVVETVTVIDSDGSEAEFDTGVAQIEFMGEILGGRVMFADSDTQPLLGLTALESAGMLVDPEAQQLIRRPYLRL